MEEINLQLRKMTTILLLIVSVNAFSGGFFVGSKETKQPVDIVQQTSILSFKDNQQTLILTTVIESDSKKIGWIIPVPNESVKISNHDNGVAAILNRNVDSRLYHNTFFLNEQLPLLIALLLILFVVRLHQKKQKPKIISLLFTLSISLVAVLYILCLAGTRSSPHFTTSYRNKKNVYNKTEIDDYEHQIAKNPQQVTHWLKEKQLLPINNSNSQLLKQFHLQGWKFLCVDFNRKILGKTKLPSLAVKFKTSIPKYPFNLQKLTLFTIANSQYICQKSKPTVVDKSKISVSGEHFYMDNSKLDFTRLADIMWEGCIISRIDNKLKSYQFTQKPFKRSHRKYNYTLKYLTSSLINDTLILFVAILLITIIANIFTKRTFNKLIIILFIVAFTTCITFRFLSPDKIVSEYTEDHIYQNFREIENKLIPIILDNRILNHKRGIKELKQTIYSLTKQSRKYQELQEGTEPNNFYIKVRANGRVEIHYINCYGVDRGIY